MSEAVAPRIVVTEAFSPRHLGNWALAVCAVEQLKAVFPNARITLLARDPEGIEKVSGECTVEKLFPRMPHHSSSLTQILWLLPNAIWLLASAAAVGISGRDPARSTGLLRALTPRGPRRPALEAILEADLVVSISGESINEKFLKKLPFVLFTYWLPARLGKPVVLFPQSFGPMRSRFWRKMTRAALGRCIVIMPRDERSLQFLLNLGIPPERCPLVYDMAIALRPIGERETKALLEELGLAEKRGPRIAVVPSIFQKSGDNHIKRLAGAVRLFLDRHAGAEVVTLIGNHRGGICKCNDYDVAQQFMELLDRGSRVVSLLDHDLSPAEIKGICSSFDLLISCRMHFSILSTMACTPTIALATQEKIWEYMSICGQEERVVALEDGLSEERLLRIMEETLKSAPEIASRLAVARDRLQPLVAAAGEHAKQALSDTPG